MSGAPVHEELHRVLTAKFHVPADLWQELASRLRELEQTPAATVPLSVAVPDPEDVPILTCAVAAKANVFVTGDKALLDLIKINDMPILSPRQLWTQLSGIKDTPRRK